MIFLKACPKCLGDLMLESDIYGKYLACLQCGLTRDLPESFEPEAEEVRRLHESEAA